MTETLAAVACCAPLGAQALSDDEALATADVVRALGDSHRVKIVNLLARRREPVSVDEFIEPLRLAQPTVSHHLKKLAEAGLLDREQRAQRVYYSLNKDALRTLAAVVDLRGVCC
jgi:ArsR family transcriptional regulator